jgi:hypothetical protein
MLTTARAVRASRSAIAVFAPLLLLGGARVVRAQSSATTVRDGWVAGALVGRIAIDDISDARATSIGVEATRFTPRRPGLDVAVVTIPTLYRDGQIPLHARIGVAIPLGMGHGPSLVPTAGVDAAGALGESAGGWVGYHLGARVLAAARRIGVQAGVVWVRAANAPNALWLVELGLMRVPAPAPPKPRAPTTRPGQF